MKTTYIYVKSAVLCVSILLFQNVFSQSTSTEIQLSGTTSNGSILNNVATVVDPNVVVTANGTVTDFTVSITGSYTTGDVLAYTGTLPVGITAQAWSAAKRSLVFKGTTTPANWQTFIRTVTLQTTSAVCNPEARKVSFVVGEKYYNALNEHFYTYYSTTGSWTTGKAFGETNSYYGREGYLVTLTSAAENTFVKVLIGQNAWIGCSDNYAVVNDAVGYTLYANQTAAEGNFYWASGPERGLKISATNSCGAGIGAVNYQNWAANEPNDWPNCNTSPGEEDYGHLYTSAGNWNDFANTQNIGSIIEWGGMPNDNSFSQVVFTRNIVINGAPSGTITGGNVTVCPTTNSTPLTLTGLSGTVVRWESSTDNFLSVITSIANTTTSYTATNISQNMYYRAVVNSTSGCNNLTTSSTMIIVSNTLPGNIVAQNNTICPGADAQLTLYGNTGSVLNWQVSTTIGFTSGNTTISNTATTINHNLTSAGTYYFRALVQNSGCVSSYTSGYTITVSAGTPPVGGSVSMSEHCSTSNSGTLTLTGQTGSIEKWQYSTDGGVIWIDVANTTTSLAYSNILLNRLYRAKVTNGSCGFVYSSSGQIFIYGTTITKWIGTTSTDWANASNWCGSVADNGIGVVVSSTATNDLVLDQDRLVGNFDFNASGKSVVLGSNTLTANYVYNGSSSSYFKTNGTGELKLYIISSNSSDFPVGNTAYNPVSITNNTGSGDYFTVNLEDQVYLDGSSGAAPVTPHVERTWNISKTNANAGSGIDMVFQWNPGEESASLNTPSVNHHNGTGWEFASGAQSNTATSATVTGYTGTFSPFAIGGDAASPLPINLDYFNGQCDPSSALLSWRTLSEINTEYFHIEKSTDNYSWSEVGTVPATGNSQVASNYQWTDPQSTRGLAYYRLIQTDIDGKSTVYGPISVACENNQIDLEVFPNPANDNFNLQVQSKSNTQLLMHIESAQGQNMMVTSVDLKEGISLIPIQTNGWADGLYLIRIQLNGELIIRKIVIHH